MERFFKDDFTNNVSTLALTASVNYPAIDMGMLKTISIMLIFTNATLVGNWQLQVSNYSGDISQIPAASWINLGSAVAVAGTQQLIENTAVSGRFARLQFLFTSGSGAITTFDVIAKDI